MIDHYKLIYDVFNYMRRHGTPLGVSEYLLVIKDMNRFGRLESIDQFRQFKRFCRLIWSKSLEDQELFDIAFAQFFESYLPPFLKAKSFEYEENRSTSETERDGPEAMPPEHKENESEIERGESVTRQRPRIEEGTSVAGANGKPREAIQRYGKKRTQLSLHQMKFSDDKAAFMDLQPTNYQFIPNLPIGLREMAEIWRHFRKLQRVGPPEELDVDATINDVCKNGFFLKPKLQPRKRNQAKLLLLMDQRGSMAPFSLIIEALVNSILRSGLSGRFVTYYFHDCPKDILFEEPALNRAIRFEEVLSNQNETSSILIVSDAGAARGFFDEERLADTRNFIQTLSKYTYLYAWLNPVPSSRWKETTAEDIANLVPMFHLSRDGLSDTISILRGYPFPAGVDLHAKKP